MLKSLADHDAERHAARMADNARWQTIFDGPPAKNGLACPACGEELFDTNPLVNSTLDPPATPVHCVCGFKSTRLL
jgi:hypothetical protein